MTDTTVKQTDIISKKDEYIHFSAAERLGNALATRETFQAHDWAEIESEARRLWQEKHDRPWSEFREVVRQAWAETRSQFSTEVGPVEDPDSYQAIFRRHYETHYADSQYGYNQYAPAYHYGYDLAVDGRLSQTSWAQVEPIAHHHWQHHSYDGPWEDFETAIHYVWSETRKRRAS